MVCECSFDDVNGEYATYALAWGEACVHDVSVDAAFVQRVADALNGQDVPPEHVYNVLDNFTVWAKPPRSPAAGGNERQAAARPGPRFGGFAQVSLPKRRAKKQNFRNILRKFDSGIPFVRPFVVTPPTLCYNK